MFNQFRDNNYHSTLRILRNYAKNCPQIVQISKLESIFSTFPSLLEFCGEPLMRCSSQTNPKHLWSVADRNVLPKSAIWHLLKIDV